MAAAAAIGMSALSESVNLLPEELTRARQTISTSALLKEFPWNSEIVFHPGPWIDFLKESPWAQVDMRCHALVLKTILPLNSFLEIH